MNNKVYIGCHKTDDLDDGYLGSGKILQQAIKKYGPLMFQREILAECSSSEEMFDMEAKYVTESFVADGLTYNLCAGGKGGFDYLINKKKTDPEWAKSINQKISATLTGRTGTFTGKTHTKEAKAEIGAKNAVHQKGKKNSQYGTCWIHNNRISKKIEKHDLNEYLIEGWIKGRKMKFKI